MNGKTGILFGKVSFLQIVEFFPDWRLDHQQVGPHHFLMEVQPVCVIPQYAPRILD